MRNLTVIMVFLAAALWFQGCGKKYVVLKDVPDAENILRTDGRLFVSGGKNVYEIHRRSDGSFYKESLYAGECNFTGIARRGSTLYTVCTTGGFWSKKRQLLAASLADPKFEVIYKFSNISLPNGIAFDDQGRLYVANTAIIGGKIVRLTFANSRTVSGQSTWLKSGVTSPNGIRIVGRTLYLTDLGSVKEVAIKSDGKPGSVRKVYGRFSVLDDFMKYGSAYVVTDFLRGTIFYLSGSGAVQAESPVLTFAGPSSITRAGGPEFSDRELLVTEKGLLGNSSPAIGNRLVRFVPGE